MSDETPHYEDPEPPAEPLRGRKRRPGPATTRAQMREAEKDQEQLVARRVQVARAMLSQDSGREFLAWLLHDVCALHHATENPTFDDSVAHFRAGQRDVGLKLHRLLLEADRSGYMALLTDHLD